MQRWSRRALLGRTGAVVAGVVLSGGSGAVSWASSAGGGGEGGPRPSADEALERLLEGNRRFAQGQLRPPRDPRAARQAVAQAQHPFAAVLGCSDSRVPPELVFDQGLGELFVARVAGNIPSDDMIATLEFAVLELAVPLVVVLGHERCGAVTATVEAVQEHSQPEGHLGVLIDAIRPAVEAVRSHGGDLVAAASTEHVRRTVAALGASRPVLGESSHAPRIVGAYYDVDDGTVRTLT